MSGSPARSPRSLILAYAAPYFAYVAIGALGDPRTHPALTCAARLVVVGGLLALYWRDYAPFRGPRSAAGSLALGALAGVAGTALWVGLRWPFADPGAASWSDAAWAARGVGASLLPPLIEEPLFRGWVLGVVLLFERARRAKSARPLDDALDRASLADVPPGGWSVLAVGVSSALFAAGHLPGEWLAAFAYGVGMCALWIARGDLLSCISAHAVTNATLAIFVLASGQWGIW